MRHFRRGAQTLLALTLFLNHVLMTLALDLDPTQPDQVKGAAKKVAAGLMKYYVDANGKVIGTIPGMLPKPPYFWWESGAMWNEMINYWYYTKDTSYNDMIRDGIMFQIGENRDFKPSNQSFDEGNDDQVFWAFTAMSAAELNFPNPPADKPGWLELAQSVFNQQTEQWDPNSCGGGLRWQLQRVKGGYDYKNTPSNGGLFQLSARLALYTGNDTYATWANKVYDWMAQSPLITKDFKVFDGTDVKNGCKDATLFEWTYNYGIMIGGAAYMYNYTKGGQTWADRLNGFLVQAEKLFPQDKGGVMVEVACEEKATCNIDQLSFKAYLARWLGAAVQLAPSVTAAKIIPWLQVSAKAAARQCGDGGQCGSRWYQPESDGLLGAGQQMTALSVVTANLVNQVAAPVTANTGGTSKGNPAAGSGEQAPILPDSVISKLTTADRAGAWILTVLVLVGLIGGGWFIVT